MHLAGGALTPQCVALTTGAAVAGLAASFAALRASRPNRNKLLLAGALGSFVFAAQAINVPIAPGMSAHLVGGVLLAWMIGPALGSLTMAAVLVLQAVALGDGAAVSLGANLLNMALLPAAIVAVARRFSTTSSVAIAASLAVPLAALLIVVETALFRSPAELAGWGRFTVTMLAAHAWIGIFEGALTVALVTGLESVAASSNQRSAYRPALAALSIGLAIAAIFVSGSMLPDGYEFAAKASGMAWLLK